MPAGQPVRLPLVTALETRDSTALKDSKMVNCFFEKLGDGGCAAKRPGIAPAFSGTAGQGQGMFSYLNVLYSISGDHLCSQGNALPQGFAKLTNAATFSPRYSHGVVSFLNKIWVLGGINNSETTLGDVYDSVDGINFVQVTTAAPWGPRSDFQLIVFNNTLYLLGGRNGSTFYGDVWSTPDGVTWTQITARGFGPRSNFGACLFQNKIWIAGGYGTAAGNAYNDIYSSSDGINWFKPAGQSTCPWAARAKFGFGAVSNLLVVLGGDLSFDLPTAAGDLWTSPDGSAWTRVTANPFGQAANLISQQVSWTTDGQEYSIAPTLSFSGGGGTGAAATAYLDSQDSDTSTIALVTVTNQGGGYTDAPTITVSQDGTSIQAGFLAYLLANSTAGDKRGFMVTDAVNGILYFIADENMGSDASTTEVWKSTNGTTWSLYQTGPQWGQRRTSATYAAGFWIIGGKNSTSPATYYDDVWGSPLSGSINVALTSVTAAGLRYTFNQTAESITTPLMVLKSTKDAYVYNTGTNALTKVTNSNYPTTTVPGIAYLDGSFYVMNSVGQIFGSAINDFTSWTALNMIPMQAEPNGGVALAKYANYILALGQWSLQFFYDNNNPAPGSPLATNSSLTANIGCASGDSMVEMQGTVLWIGQTKDSGRAVYMVANLSPQRISTPFVDRILQADPLTSVYAYATGAEGHTFYVLTLVNSGITLVYDFQAQDWYQWTSRTLNAALPVTTISCDAYGTVTATCTGHGRVDGDPVLIAGGSDPLYNGIQNVNVVDLNTFTYQVNGVAAANTGTVTMTPSTESYFMGAGGAVQSGAYYVQHYSSGVVYKLDSTIYADDSAPIDMRVKTLVWDGGTRNWKTFPDVGLVADVASARGLLRYSNDDYNTWSSYRSIDMSTIRQHLTRMGRARRRAYEFRFTANTPMRARAIEFIPELGDF